jgi:hypothetical protein
MANVKISALPAVTTLAGTDVLPCVKDVSGTDTTSRISVSDLANAIGTGNTLVSNSSYTASPVSSDYIQFSDTTGIYAGQTLRLQQNATTYHLVTSLGASNEVYLSGPPLEVGVPIVNDSLFIIDYQRNVAADIVFSGAYAIGGATDNLISRETRSGFRWHGPPSRLLYVAARTNADDSQSTKATLNVSINGTTGSLTSVITLSGTSWVGTANGNIPVSNASVSFGQDIEVQLKNAGGDGDGRDLIVSLVFLLEE